MSDFQSICRSAFGAANSVRVDPRGFIGNLEEYKSSFGNNRVRYRKGAEPLMTAEGKYAVLEAIQELNTCDALSELRLSEGLSKAAQSLCNSISQEEEIYESLSERLNKFGTWKLYIAESLDYGSLTGLDLVCALLVDDGVPTRAHRKALLNPKVQTIGIGSAPHRDYTTVSCVLLSDGFLDSRSSPSVYIPEETVTLYPYIENWPQGAFRVTCEVREEQNGNKLIQVVTKYCEFENGEKKIIQEEY